MKQTLLILMLGLFSFFGYGQTSILKQAEIDLVTNIGFKPELFAGMKAFTKNDIQQLPAIEEETGDVLKDTFYEGLCSGTENEKAVDFVKENKSKYKENGCLVFVFEGEEGQKNVAVIKGSDELEILRYRKTGGINYGIGNDDIVNKIAEWNAKYGLIVLGCGRDWLQVEFEKLPADVDKFAEEVYAFCPDPVDQGVGSIKNLRDAIIELRGVWLWWD